MSTSLRRYYRGADLVAMKDGQSGAKRYYRFDHQGTTQCLTDGTGAVTDRFAADAWGVQVKRTGSSINRHWYIGSFGYETRQLSFDFYVRQRYLSGPLGRFLSVEPEHESSLDRYLYIHNAPVIETDPSGLPRPRPGRGGGHGGGPGSRGCAAPASVCFTADPCVFTNSLRFYGGMRAAFIFNHPHCNMSRFTVVQKISGSMSWIDIDANGRTTGGPSYLPMFHCGKQGVDANFPHPVCDSADNRARMDETLYSAASATQSWVGIWDTPGWFNNPIPVAKFTEYDINVEFEANLYRTSDIPETMTCAQYNRAARKAIKTFKWHAKCSVKIFGDTNQPLLVTNDVGSDGNLPDCGAHVP